MCIRCRLPHWQCECHEGQQAQQPYFFYGLAIRKGPEPKPEPEPEPKPEEEDSRDVPEEEEEDSRAAGDALEPPANLSSRWHVSRAAGKPQRLPPANLSSRQRVSRATSWWLRPA